MAKKFDLPKIEEMLEAGVHFGHRVKRHNPQMDRYVYEIDKKADVIDVYQTVEALEKACEFLYETAKEGKQIILVGTKRQAAAAVEELAQKSGAMYVSQRWLGGTLTNFDSIKGKTKQLKKLTKGVKEGEFNHYTKKERLMIDREIEKLNLFVGGIQDIEKYPAAIVVVDVKKERVVVNEANAVNVPVVGLVDTNSDPRNVDYVIPANDDAMKSIRILLESLTSAIEAGYKEYEKASKKDAKVEKGTK